MYTPCKRAAAAANANLTIQKSHEVGNFNWGQHSALYTITVANTGSVATSGTVTVTDTLPAGLSFVSASSLGWSYSELGQVVTITTTSLPSRRRPFLSSTCMWMSPPDAENPVINSASVACNVLPCTVGPPASDPTTLAALAPPPPPPANVAPASMLNRDNLAVLILLFLCSGAICIAQKMVLSEQLHFTAIEAHAKHQARWEDGWLD